MNSRRSFLRGFFGLAAAAATMPVGQMLSGLKFYRQAVLYDELAKITRKAFSDRLYVQIYEAQPFMKHLVDGRGHEADLG